MKILTRFKLCAGLALFAAVIVPGYAQNPGQADYTGHREVTQGSFAWQLGNGGAVNAKWPSSVLKWFYNPAGQPADLSTTQIVATIQRAMARWSDVCNIAFAYQGETTRAANLDATFDVTDRIPVVAWGPLTGNRAGFGGWTAFWYLNSGSMIDADMVINTAISPAFNASRLFELEALIVHETGHMLGINHSEAKQSVMFNNPYNSYKFQRTLRGDDAAACAQIYGASTLAGDNRVFNWAEVAFEQFFSPVGGVSGQAAGYLYRYYPDSGSYVGTKDGNVFVLLRGGAVTSVGRAADFLPQAVSAGF